MDDVEQTDTQTETESSAITQAHLTAFREALLTWYSSVKRDMPWRATDDPYRIWVSEVMLQQTRVDQAEPYYHRFIEQFPTVQALADAPLDDVLLCWEGLGYYSRARHLHEAAQQVAEEFDGRVPEAYNVIRTLPGIGPYTAAAVLSIAYGKPHAVLDGNVIRVLSRVFQVEEDVTSSRTRRKLQELADQLLHSERPGTFNEALMELGAVCCTPANPGCNECPLQSVCGAFEADMQDAYPVKKRRAAVPHHDVVVGLIADDEGRFLVQQRPTDVMLGGLWEFPGGKRRGDESLQDACRRELEEELGITVEVGPLFHRLKHAYSHFRITLHAFPCQIISGTPTPPPEVPLRWVAPENLENLAFPRANRRLIEELQERRQAPMLFDDRA